MASIVVAGDTSGSVTLSAPLVAGTSTVSLQPQSGTMALTLGQIGMKNRIINGAMVIDQRNAGSAYTGVSNNQYTLDRWVASVSQSSRMNVQQNAGSVTPPAGFTNYLGITVGTAVTSLGATDYFQMMQKIEGFNTADLNWGTANAKTVTLSFWVRSNLTGTFGGAISNATQDRNYPFSYTISSANTWEQKSVTIAGDTTGTWVGATNGIGVWVNFGLGTGTTYSGTAGAWTSSLFVNATGNTNLMASTSNSWYVTGVQLEVGSTATSFDFRPYGTELQLCQRYFWQLGGSNAGNLSYYFPQPGNQPSGGGGMPLLFTNPAQMRTAPDVSFNLTSGNYTTGTPSGTQWLLIAPNIDVCSFSGSTVQLFGAGSTTMAGVQLLYANISRQPSIIVFGSTAWIRFSSEL